MMRKLITFFFALAVLVGTAASSFAQGGMGPGPGTPHSTGVAWTPANLPSLLAWYKADAGLFTDTGCSTPAVTTNAVACWADQSGHSNNQIQATSGNRPVYSTTGLGGTKKAVVFTAASSHYLIKTALAIGTGTSASVFAVGQLNSGANTYARIVSYATISGADYNFAGSAAFILRDASNQNLQIGASGSFVSTQAITYGTTFYFGSVFDGANITSYLNNSAGTPSAYTAAFVSGGDLGVGAAVASGTATNGFWDGPLSEIVITTNAINSTDRANLQAYFASRW
jgi:hypothetical protein